MPQIILGPGTKKVDGSVQKQVMAFLLKLTEDDTAPGLHIEPMHNPSDARVRTGRVNDFYRAVLFKVQGSQNDASYVYAGTYPHDEAIDIARKSKLNINPRNGVAELIPVDDVAPESVAVQHVPASTTADVATSEPTLRDRSFTVDDLTALGIDAAFALGALDLAGDDVIIEYAAGAPASWQGSALLDLYTGETFEDIRKAYQLDVPTSVDPDDDDAIIAAMRHPAAQLEFAFIEDDEDLQAAIENPDFNAWRIFLHPEQRKYATLHTSGAYRLSGGAGTGKTVVLLHRARELHQRNPSARIVLTTFNRTLADELAKQLRVLDPAMKLADDLGQPGVYVAGVDAIARRVLSTATDLSKAATAVLGARTAQVLNPTSDKAWDSASEQHTPALLPSLRSPAFLEAEYSTVVLPNQVTTREEYLKVRRVGRGVALNRARRLAVWDIIASYRAAAAAAGTTDFDEKASLAAAALDTPPADHVLVDEAQDLSPCRLILMRALVAEGPDDLFLAEDAHQRIYGQRITLGRYGIHIVGRARRLTLNYRTTQENLLYALGILSGENYTDMIDDEAVANSGYRSARTGPAPRVKAVVSLSDLYKEAAALVRGWLDSGVRPDSIGLLVPTRREAENLPRALGDHEVPATYVGRDGSAPPNAPAVMTMHRSKGMEFAKVILVGIGEKSLPRTYLLDEVAEEDRSDVLQRERSLLYVAATRARDELVVMYSGEPSVLLP
ncbi:ATP-dependent DNA helicase UvrD [uncultured Mycobacterium sp.]|uniref:DNA 3'-5' helicase n=1 Tax=uncultured Mycobacterium sp. TaxID=171292 RepID=A0A1Y5PKT0_9MYCO|nr:ATP-dependent DNA helicase UvrD [uncultured Mycobacterium sp.]